MKLPVVGPSYQMDALSFDVQRTINQYPLVSESGSSKEVSALKGTPGYDTFTDLTGGPIRGGITAAKYNRAFGVSGDKFYEILADGTKVERGTLLTQTGIVGIAENGNEIMIADNPNGYIFNLLTNTFTQITDPDFPGAVTVVFLDGYFIVLIPDTQEYSISGLYDGLAWDGLDRTTVESSPDNLVGLIAINGDLWLFGSESTEVHTNTGNANFPFERIPGAVIPVGLAATHAVIRYDNTVAWLGRDRDGRAVIWRGNGYSAQRISTQAIERLIASVTDYGESYAWVYHQEGHMFGLFQVKGLDTTLVIDAATNLWHERQFMGIAQHRGSCHFFFNQKNLIGDRLSGKIYELSLNKYSDDGEEIIRRRITPHIQEEKKLIPHNRVELDMEVGVGLNAGQGSDPQIMMRYSDDGGRTWSAELWRSIGKMGKYGQRVKWDRLGMARDRVYEFSYSDPTKYQINGCYLNAS